MGLADEVKKLRERHRLTKAEFAGSLGLSPMYVTLLERTPSKRKFIPSVKVIRKIAELFTFGEEERIVTERKLLLELAKLKAPDEIASYFENTDKEERLYYGESMPLVFIEKLRKDAKCLEDSDKKAINKMLKKSGITQNEFEALKQCKYTVNRQKVIALAIALKQPVEEYLLLADYLPDNIKNLSKNKKWATMLGSFADLSPETIDQMIDIIQNIISMYKKGGGYCDGK